MGRFSGVVLVTKGDSVIYNNSFGLADYEYNISFSDITSFKIGAISELITAGIIREMAGNGEIDLSAPVSTYLSEIKGDYSINDLLHHKSPLPTIQTLREAHPKKAFSAIDYANLSVDKDDTSQKSDLGYHLLGLVIEEVSKKSFQEVIQEYSSRLGLENTYFKKEDPAVAVGYLYHNFRGEGLELERSAFYDPNIAFSSHGLKSTARDLAVVLKTTPEREIDIAGYLENDGFSYSVVKNSETGVNIIVLSNRRHPVAREISNSINAILREGKYDLPLPRRPFTIDPVLLEEYAGTYSFNEKMNLEIISAQDSLFVVMGPNKIYLVPQSTNQFYMKERDAALRFIRDTNQRVQKAILLDGFLVGNEIIRQ